MFSLASIVSNLGQILPQRISLTLAYQIFPGFRSKLHFFFLEDRCPPHPRETESLTAQHLPTGQIKT